MKLQLIHIKDYLLAVDDSNYYDEYYLNKVDMQIYKRVDGGNIPTVGGVWHKKITHHLPLNNAPVLEGVELLPPLKEAERLAENKYPIQKGGSMWMPTAQEVYKFTEEDMKKAMQKACLMIFRYGYLDKEKIIKSISKPKLPTSFDTETKQYIYEVTPPTLERTKT